MTPRRRRHTVVLEVAALMIALVAASGWLDVSPMGAMAAAGILLFAASLSRLRHYMADVRRSSSPVPYAGAAVALVIAVLIAWRL